MAAIDLLFNAEPYGPGSIALVFGGTGGAAPAPVVVTHTFTFAAPSFSMAVVYDNRVTRWRDQRVTLPHQVASAQRIATDSVWGLSRTHLGGTDMSWGKAAPQQVQVNSPTKQNVKRRTAVDLPWQVAQALDAMVNAPMQVAALRRARADALWQLAQQVGMTATEVIQTGARRRVSLLALWQLAQRAQVQASARMGASRLHRSRSADAPWQQARIPAQGREAWPPLTGITPPGYLADLNLLFQCPPLSAPWLLLFGAQPCYVSDTTFFILPARFYMTSHNLIAHRLPDLAELPLYDCTLSADIGSFAWQFSASGPESLFVQLSPSAGLPQQLQITLDGMTWVFVVESLKRDHQFGKRRVSISGRSATALIGVPWTREAAYNNANAATAQQLAAQALDLSGVALDWGITDWLVPANAWSYAGTRLAAVQAIAEAAGGYLQSHRSNAALQVRHPYPPRPDGSTGGPWNWSAGAADIELAPDAIITSAIERKDGPDINAIYASGTTQGVLALVKRAGTAGDKLAVLQTDALITHADAARQRGLATLGKAGPQYAISLELPVLTGSGQPGVINVGQLVQINDATPWRGRVRSVSVNAAMPTARQTITLERHL